MKKARYNVFYGPADGLYFTCVACGHFFCGFFEHLGENAHYSRGRAKLPAKGIFLVPCKSCERPLKVLVEQVPFLHYTEASETCSPDRSTVCVRVRSEERIQVSIKPMLPSVKPHAPPAVAAGLEGKLAKLRELRELEQRLGEQVGNDPEMQRRLRALVGKEISDIMKGDARDDDE